MKHAFLAAVLAILASCAAQPSPGPGPAPVVHQPITPPGDPVLEEPTLHCLGAYWIVDGDPDKKWHVDMAYRKAGAAEWKQSMPMFRVRKGDTMQKTHEAELNPPDSAWLFAGSIVNLTPGTAYELRLTLVKADGSKIEKVLKSKTASEPVDPVSPRIVHVIPAPVPGNGGGDGTETNPYQGLEAAQAHAAPGTIFLLHKGVYPGGFHIERSGAEGAPIIWRGAGDGEAIINGTFVPAVPVALPVTESGQPLPAATAPAPGAPGRATAPGRSPGRAAGRRRVPATAPALSPSEHFGLEMSGIHDVRFDKLSIRGFFQGVLAIDCSRIAITHCRFTRINRGIYFGSGDDKGNLRNNFIADNDLDGPFKWGDDILGGKAEEYRGIQVTGAGYDICYNRVRGFKDGIDTFPSKVCAAIDIHHNDVSDSKDDGCEMDFSERNTRCFLNLFTNMHQGVSEQPIYGGPTYIFRNVLYNVHAEPFKLHHVGGPGALSDNWPSGAILYHNTVVKKDDPCILNSPSPVYNCVYRNNLFIGGGRRAFSFEPMMNGCDFDYDALGGGPWELFMKWNKVYYQTFAEAKTKAPVEHHAVLVDAAKAFAAPGAIPTDWRHWYDPAKIDLRPAMDYAAVAAGEVLPGFNDGFAGKAPMIGAYEPGQELPHYGPRP